MLGGAAKELVRLNIYIFGLRRGEEQTRGARDEMVGCTLLLSEIKCSLPRAALSFNFTDSL